MYKLIAAISMLLRQFIISNPFEKLPEPIVISWYRMSVAIPPVVLNWIAEPLLHTFTFAVAGFYYRRGVDHPAKGSLLYLFFYYIHVVLLQVLAGFSFTNITIAIVVIGYLASHVGFLYLNHRISEYCKAIF